MPDTPTIQVSATSRDAAIVRACAAAICPFCGAPPESYAPAVRGEDGDWEHAVKRKGDGTVRHCDAGAIWDKFPPES